MIKKSFYLLKLKISNIESRKKSLKLKCEMMGLFSCLERERKLQFESMGEEKVE